MAKNSRTRARKEFVTPNGTEIHGDLYCRRCMDTKPPKEFYAATDSKLDSNGLMSICKSCSNEIFEEEKLRNRTFKKTMLSTCRILNMMYDEDAIDATWKTIVSLEEKGRSVSSPIGIFRGRLASMVSRSDKMEASIYNDLSFMEPSRNARESLDTFENEDVEMVSQSEFWGDSFTSEELEFLEKEYRNFKKSHILEGYGDEVLLKQICYLLLDIDKDRKEGNPTSKSVKELQSLMKSLAVSPDMSVAANSGKNVDAFGMWIKDIENYSPAEWVEDKDVFYDLDNFDQYFKDYIVRPIKNFITGSRDFNVGLDED